MEVTLRELKRIISEIEAEFEDLDDETREKVVDSLQGKVEDEGGALGPELARQTVQDTLGSEVDDEDFEDIAIAAGLHQHGDGDLVDPTDLSAIEESRFIRISRTDLRRLVRESYEGARPATPDELEYIERLQGIQRSRRPGQSVEQRMEKLEAKVDAILDMIGEL
jgi:predicted transcriptional regulator